MTGDEIAESGLEYALERTGKVQNAECRVQNAVRGRECGDEGADSELEEERPRIATLAEVVGLYVSRDWRGRVSQLGDGALKAFWQEALAYARSEIGQYGCWWRLEEPVLPSGYDAEGVVQTAFERLIEREGRGVPILYSAEGIRQELRRLVKHRVRWLHERVETRLLVSEWDVLPPGKDGELVSIFEYIPGKLASPDEELMRKEKARYLEEFKSGFEAKLGRKVQLREVFGRLWDGQKRREVAKGLGWKPQRVTNVQRQLMRRLAAFASEARGGVAETLEAVRQG